VDVTTVAAVWPISSASQIEPLQGGINNRTFRVVAEVGGEASDYILRLYPATASPQSVAFETAVLSALAPINLPFGLPRPIPARNGEVAPRVPTGNGEALALLVPVLPGRFTEPSSPLQAESAGAALGMLHRALAGVTVPVAPRPTYGELGQIDPHFPDPRRAPDWAPVNEEERVRLGQLVEEVLTQREHWYSTLPQQIIHGDYVPYNLLLEGNQITAVLDFELANRDLRALDFTMGLWAWLNWKGNLNWAFGEAFVRGYRAHIALTEAEIQAIPSLLRLRKAATLVWWAARQSRGAAAEGIMEWAAKSALEAEAWIEANGADLVERLWQVSERLTGLA